jgi:hypothetical protein
VDGRAVWVLGEVDDDGDRCRLLIAGDDERAWRDQRRVTRFVQERQYVPG